MGEQVGMRQEVDYRMDRHQMHRIRAAKMGDGRKPAVAGEQAVGRVPGLAGGWIAWHGGAVALVAGLFVLVGLLMHAAPARADTGEPLCRFGVNVSSFPDHAFYIDDFDIAPLRAGWYLDYRATPSPAANNGAQYVLIMGVGDNDAGGYGYSPTGANLDATIAAHPGGIYIVGNEPDRREVQHDVLPENYARIYHAAYAEIKAKDPAAQVWAGAIVQPTPLRLEYLDRVLATYRAEYGVPMPVDGWAIHSFILNEASCSYYKQFYPDDPVGLSNECWGADIPPGIDATDGVRRTVADNARLDLFTEGIRRFRTWMAANGYRQTPLYVTEYGVLMPPSYGFPAGTVNRYMRDTFDFMLDTTDPALGYGADGNRLVQRFAWFSTLDPGFNGYLYESTSEDDPYAAPFELSPMGEQFRDYTAQESATSDLALLRLDWHAGQGRLVAVLGNQGNRMQPTQATVRFYAGTAWASAVPIGEAVTTALAGCGETRTVAVPWTLETEEVGTLRVWASITQTDFPDATPDDNTLSRVVLVNGQQTFLPLVR